MSNQALRALELTVGFIVLFAAIFGAAYVLVQPREFVLNEGMTAPPLTEELRLRLAGDTKGFQGLVSYTEHGFVGNDITVNVGDVVRFTNNSGGAMWISSGSRKGSAVYPGESDCGLSLFNTCAEIAPGEHWEFTFDKEGDWTYVDSLHPENVGVIRVVANTDAI